MKGSGELALMPPQPGTLISESEQREAREACFSEARRRGEVVTVGSYPQADELTFHFGERWVEGVSVYGERVRIRLEEVRRFDLDYRTQEGDDKTHYFYYLLLASDKDTLVYTERAPEPAYNPLPEPSRNEKSRTNLGALAALSRIEGRSTFELADPEGAFSWAAPKSAGPSPGKKGETFWVNLLAILFILIALYYAVLR